VTEAGRLYAARDYLATATVCRTIILDDPHHFDARHLLGVLLTGLVRHGAAANAFDQAIRAHWNHAPGIKPREIMPRRGSTSPPR
jgi:hypothetical protein